MKNQQLPFLSFLVLTLIGCQQAPTHQAISVDERNHTESIAATIKIDSVWAGHPVGFCLLTDENRQYIAYYNAQRNMVVGQRGLDDPTFSLTILPATSRETAGGTSTVLGWDSHNYVTIGIDKQGFIHLSGNVHAHPLTYFRSRLPGDISTLEQIFEMTGEAEKRTTYPRFFKTREGELIYTYRDGGSGNGNQIYNLYDTATKSWSRLLEEPLTDGQGQMNAYISSPQLREDDWYHTYWVWRDTPDCSTNHDLSYMKSPDLKNWFNAFGEKVDLPATIEDKHTVVDPIPVKGGIINLAAKLAFDKNKNPVFAYHKYDSTGNLQFYTAQMEGKKWVYKQITDWDYRWEFSGNGSINKEVNIKAFRKRKDDFYEINYWHIKYGNGTILLNDQFESIGQVLKSDPFDASLGIEGDFPGLQVQTSEDIGQVSEENTRYILKWESLNRNRDGARPKPWPAPSQLYLYKLKGG
ncbi:MAG: BNR repeat-containing protein [Saprospiraceae bacterium]